MPLNNHHILITADVDESLLHKLKEKHFVVDVIPFIQTEIIKTENLRQQIENIANLDATVVFTSKNAVNAVNEYLSNKKTSWKIYCIGNTTKTLVENLFDKNFIADVGDNATEIAQSIIESKNTNAVYFFCGNKRRDELPDRLRKNNIIVSEVEVYTTTIFHCKVDINYDAALFFSPSAVEGFFADNILNDKTILFAIGQTTANKIRKYSTNKIVISNKPGKKDLIERVIIFFSSADL